MMRGDFTSYHVPLFSVYIDSSLYHTALNPFNLAVFFVCFNNMLFKIKNQSCIPQLILVLACLCFRKTHHSSTDIVTFYVKFASKTQCHEWAVSSKCIYL